jgi:hypothetical protein
MRPAHRTCAAALSLHAGVKICTVLLRNEEEYKHCRACGNKVIG